MSNPALIEIPTKLRDIRGKIFELSQVDSQWFPFLTAENIRASIEKTHEYLAQNPEDVEAKLWWIDLECRMGVVPISALCSPLEEVADRIEEDLPKYALFAAVSLEIVSSLVQKEQTRLAVVIFRRAFSFAAKSGVLGRKEQFELRDYLEVVTGSEIERAKSRQEKQQYLGQLNELLVELRKFKPKVPVADRKPEALPKPEQPSELDSLASNKSTEAQRKRRTVPLSAKSILQQSLEASLPEPGVDSDHEDWTLEATSSADLDSSSAKQTRLEQPGTLDEQKKPKFSKEHEAYSSTREHVRAWLSKMSSPEALNGRSVTYGLIGLILLLILGALQYGQTPQYDIQPVTSRVSVLGNDLKLPELTLLPPDDPSLGQKALDSLRERLENSTNRSPTPSEKDAAKDASVDQEAIKMANEVTASRLPETSPGKTVDTIADLSGDDRDAKIPPLDPERLGQMQVEDMGRQGPGVKVPGGLLGGDGRQYGPPPKQTEGLIDPITKQPVQAYEVQQFPKPRIFRLLSRTIVLSAPSAVGVQVGQLEKGDKVEVVASMGSWLELRSAKGRPGYIYSQDAEPEK